MGSRGKEERKQGRKVKLRCQDRNELKERTKKKRKFRKARN